MAARYAIHPRPYGLWPYVILDRQADNKRVETAMTREEAEEKCEALNESEDS
jgi:hypothetical protein